MKFAILRGKIYTQHLSEYEYGCEAQFSDGLATTQYYPDGFEFQISEMGFSLDEEDKEVVLGPTKNTEVFVRSLSINDSEDDIDEIILTDRREIYQKLGVSIFKLCDLLWLNNEEELQRRIDTAIMGGDYTATY